MSNDANLRASALVQAQRLAGQVLVNGKLAGTTFDRRFELRDPATQEIICSVAEVDASDVERAVAVARAAQPGWAKLPARERGKLLIEGSRVLMAHTEELASLLELESGKALRTECRPEASNEAVQKPQVQPQAGAWVRFSGSPWCGALLKSFSVH